VRKNSISQISLFLSFNSQSVRGFFLALFSYLPSGLIQPIFKFFAFPAVAVLNSSCRVQSEIGHFAAKNNIHIR
jgi:hypothetical protein